MVKRNGVNITNKRYKELLQNYFNIFAYYYRIFIKVPFCVLFAMATCTNGLWQSDYFNRTGTKESVDIQHMFERDEQEIEKK